MRYYIIFIAFTGILLSSISHAQNSSNNFQSTVSPSIDYFNLDGFRIKKATVTDNLMTLIVLTRSGSKDSLNYHVSKRHVITIPNAEIMNSLSICIERTENDTDTTEFGFLVGRLGMVSQIEKGENKKFNAAKRSKCLDSLKVKGDRAAYDVHTHPKALVTKKDRTFDYGIAIASDSDMASYKTTLYIQPSIVLGYYGKYITELTQHICFYNRKEPAIAVIDFELFKDLIDTINQKRRDKTTD